MARSKKKKQQAKGIPKAPQFERTARLKRALHDTWERRHDALLTEEACAFGELTNSFHREIIQSKELERKNKYMARTSLRPVAPALFAVGTSHQLDALAAELETPIWELALEQQFRVSLNELAKTNDQRILAAMVLVDLCKGLHDRVKSPEMTSSGKLPEIGIDVFVTKLGDGALAIVWHYDIDFCQLAEPPVYGEIVRVWDLVLNERIDEAIGSVDKILRGSRRNIANLREVFAKQSRSFHGLGESRITYPKAVPLDSVAATDTFLLNKFFTLDTNVLQWLFHGTMRHNEFPHRINQREHELIHMRGNVLLIGRSGTGKTLCCLYRLFKDYVYCKHNGMENPQQIFMTKSHVLSNKVKEYFKKLIITHAEATGIDFGLPEDTPPNTISSVDAQPQPWPLPYRHDVSEETVLSS